MDFWSEIGPQSEKVDFLVDPIHQDRILHYIAFYGIDAEVIINDLQQEIDEEDSVKEVRRPKRQNTFFDLLSVFSSSQSRPRRKPQITEQFITDAGQPRFPRKFPGSSNLNSVKSPSPSSPVSNFDKNTTFPGMILS